MVIRLQRVPDCVLPVHCIAVVFLVEVGLLVVLESIGDFSDLLIPEVGLQTEHGVYPSSCAFFKVISFLEYLRYLQVRLKSGMERILKKS